MSSTVPNAALYLRSVGAECYHDDRIVRCPSAARYKKLSSA